MVFAAAKAAVRASTVRQLGRDAAVRLPDVESATSGHSVRPARAEAFDPRAAESWGARLWAQAWEISDTVAKSKSPGF